MFGIVYLLTNTKNGKVYVGQTTHTLDRRWRLHLSAANGTSQRVVHRAIRKYGSDAFTREILAEANSAEKLDTLEVQFIARYNSQNSPCGYNCAAGGSNPRVGSKHSEETKAKLRAAWARKKARGYKPPSTFTTKGRTSWNNGKPFSEETRKRMSISARLSWTPERRTEQSERARKQGLANLKNQRRAGTIGAVHVVEVS